MIKKILEIIYRLPQILKFSKYEKNYKKNIIKDNSYVIDYTSNLKSLLENIDSNIIYVVYKNKHELNLIKKINFDVKLIKYNSNKYYKVLSFCKYLIFNNDINNYYIKKDNQIVVNYYHDEEFQKAQRNILLSDIVLVNNEDSNILNRYMLDNLFSGQILNIKEKNEKELILYIKKYKHINKIFNKKNILTYCGKFTKNGLTSSYFNLMERVDKNRFNIIATFDNRVYKENEFAIKNMREKNILELPIPSGNVLSVKSLIVYYLYRKFNKTNEKCLNEMIDIEIKRLYGNTRFDSVINFSGYDSLKVMMFERMDAFNMLFIHNNIVQELKNKKNRHYLTIKSALKNYDKIMLVSQGIYKPTFEIAKNDSNFLIMNNICNYEEIIENSNKKVSFDKDTYCNIELSELNKVLNDDSIKFINIGRFTYEKNQSIIIDQFEKYYIHNKNSFLIIIGGYGNLFNNILKKVNNSIAKDHIIIIKSISNPMPILKKCSAFVLYSIYEAFPMTLMEADSLSIPLIMSNCEGPYAFWKEHKVKIIDINNPNELYESFIEVEEKKIHSINIDYKKYNQKWIKYFEDELLRGINSYRRKK